VTIETQRLVLDCFTEKDAAVAVELFNGESFLRFIGDRLLKALGMHLERRIVLAGSKEQALLGACERPNGEGE